MTSGPSYSIASCVVETAHRLVATPGDDEKVVAARNAGRALLTAEVLSFGSVGPGTRARRYGQGLEVTLGFYDEKQLAAVENVQELVSDEFSESIGGWPSAVQVGLRLLSNGEGWLGVQHDWPADVPFRHLDPFVPPRDVPDHRSPGQLRIIGRRLRYRLGIDHDNGRPDLFWWTTAQTDHWIQRYLYDTTPPIAAPSWTRPSWGQRRAFNRYVAALYFTRYPGGSINIDAGANSPDDWGYVNLERDPIQVRAIGPRSGGQTEADVEITLARAGVQLQCSFARTVSEQGRRPGSAQAEALMSLAHASNPDVDVVLLFRGGFSYDQPPLPIDCNHILDAAEVLTKRGIEVVLGLGHGTTDIHRIAGRQPAIGVHEAVTPSAAASWILTEHVNQRLMNSVPNFGQSRP